jgi:hypothetical protein
MKQVLRYYLTAITSSLTFFVWVLIFLFCFILPIFCNYTGIIESYLMRPLLRSQTVIYSIWAFIILQGGYWCATFANDRCNSGLSVWWSSLGISPQKQFQGLFLAGFLPCLVFIVGGLGFLALVSSFDRPIPLPLLLEQGVSIIFASLIYCGFCIMLGSMLNASFAWSLSIASFVFSVKGMLIARNVITGLPDALRYSFSWILFLLPNFDLYFRPGAIIHFWPVMQWKVWVGIALYTGIWLSIFSLVSKRIFRPCLN